jgi:hypothetical protein
MNCKNETVMLDTDYPIMQTTRRMNFFGHSRGNTELNCLAFGEESVCLGGNQFASSYLDGGGGGSGGSGLRVFVRDFVSSPFTL